MQNAGKGGFRVARPEKTKEQIEYEEATRNIKVLTTRLRLSQQGIDTSSLSRQELDRIMAIYDKMDAIAADVRNKTSEIQRESNVEIQKANQKANEKYSQVSKDIDAIINKMKKADKTVVDKPVEPVQVQGETKEEIKQEISPEKIREDIINSFTDRIMQKVRKEVVSVFEDYANMPQTKMAPSPQVIPHAVPVHQDTHQVVPGVIVGQGVVNKEATKEIALKVGKAMIEESAKIDPGEGTDDKDIPVITTEMMKKTEEEIAKRRAEKT